MTIHDKFANLAQRLIAKHGRTITVRKLSETPADGAKPWRGTGASYEYAVEVIGVMTDYREEEIDGTNILVGDKRMLAASKDVAQSLQYATSLLDNEQVWSVEAVKVIEPGTTRIMYEMRVRQ